MIWDIPHHRGAGFPLAILRPAGAYPVLAALCAAPESRPADLLERFAAVGAAYAPVIGPQSFTDGVGGTLAYLRSAGLVKRCAGSGLGAHTRYEATALGAGLAGALDPVGAWAMSDFGFVVAATRTRLHLPPLDVPVPAGLRRAHPATALALGLLSGPWSDSVMVYVDSAGPGGIGPGRLEEVVNAALAASSGEDRVARRLYRGTLYRTLHRLLAKGLLERREDPRVRYALTVHGRGLMDAWWQVAEGWGVAHDAELFRIVARVSDWFPDASGD
jgi:DNA-binding HxlR family transcriptional regulator